MAAEVPSIFSFLLAKPYIPKNSAACPASTPTLVQLLQDTQNALENIIPASTTKVIPMPVNMAVGLYCFFGRLGLGGLGGCCCAH